MMIGLLQNGGLENVILVIQYQKGHTKLISCSLDFSFKKGSVGLHCTFDFLIFSTFYGIFLYDTSDSANLVLLTPVGLQTTSNSL